MRTSKYRAAVALLFLVIVAGGLIFNLGLGTVSSFGFDKIAAICPLGALETFLASKTFVPSVFFAFLFFIVVAVIVGRAFCGWMCPVPLLRSVLGAEEKRISKGYPKGAKESEPDLEGKRADFAVADVQEEKAAFSSAKITDRSIPKGPFYVLFAALGSALVFGFPVFCLICPVGLTFGVILGVWSFFYTGSASWTLLLILAFLFLEIFFLRKWCHQFCPIGALISLVSIFNRSFRPKVSSGCYKLKGGLNCNRCSIACPEGIQLLYNPSSRELSRCIKCGKCADACPAHAIHFPLFSRKTSEDSLSQEKALTPSIASEEKVQVLDQTAPFSEKEAIAEASRCIQCGACEEKCPQKNPLRDYIRLLSEGRTQEAVKLLNASGSMPEACGRICPQDQLCESVCPLREYGGAIQIGRLTSLGGDLGLKKNWRRASVTKPRELKRKTVAIIGAGPAGLAAADVLCSFGVHTTVFDKEHEIGGLLTYGIPFFKLEKESLAKRRKLYEKQGIRFKLGVPIEEKNFIALTKDYDAVIFALGASAPVIPQFSDLAAADIIPAMDYLGSVNRLLLHETGTQPLDFVGKRVAVLGGGDTAVDCSRTSARQGASRTFMIARKELHVLKASKKDLALAIKEKVEVLDRCQILDIQRKQDQFLIQYVRGGSPETRKLVVDRIVCAYGFRVLYPEWLEKFISKNSQDNYEAGKNIFVAGEFRTGSRLATNAIEDGKEAAQAVISALRLGEAKK